MASADVGTSFAQLARQRRVSEPSSLSVGIGNDRVLLGGLEWDPKGTPMLPPGSLVEITAGEMLNKQATILLTDSASSSYKVRTPEGYLMRVQAKDVRLGQERPDR